MWNERNNAETNQWLSACSSHGEHDFPYGDLPLPGEPKTSKRCNDVSNGVGATLPVGSMPTCQASGAYAGVFDLSGNVYEWVDACERDEGFLDDCLIRGGSFGCVDGATQCRWEEHAGRHTPGPAIGFRCCSE